jgi:PilZ domain
MEYQPGNNDQRGQPRVNVEFPATVSVGTQLTVKGQLKDLSMNSAFIRIKNNLYLNINDEVGITIQCSSDDAGVQIQGLARISRMVPGEGFVVYFTKIDDNSLKNIKKVLQKAGSTAL